MCYLIRCLFALGCLLASTGGHVEQLNETTSSTYLEIKILELINRLIQFFKRTLETSKNLVLWISSPREGQVARF